MNSNIILQLRTILQGAQNILIALPEKANDDAIGAGLALYLTLKKMRKQTSIVSSGEIRVAQAYLYGIDKINKQIAGGNTLVVSLPYKEGTIEKVSYNIEGDKFNLVIEPRGEQLSFNPEEVEYNFGKGEYDAVFVLGARDFNDLGTLYTSHQSTFLNKQIINIDNNKSNANFGQINIVEKGSVSQTLAILFKALRLPLDQDPASNLYTGIISVEGAIRLDNASPDLLETIAYLMRSNARVLTNGGRDKDRQPLEEQAAPKNIKAEQPKKDIQEISEETPEDWLKPKIFSSRNN
jgi:nanoRNase/pAp phosphatase (c-di-AMP/oligoRNAs hydrolase)